MAVKSKTRMYSQNQLEQILFNFSIKKDSYRFQSLTDGLVNDTFLVLYKSTPKYILQRINHEVFQQPQALMSNIGKALFHLHGSGYAKLNMINTLLDDNYCSIEDRFWRLMEYIPESTTYNTTTDATTSFEAGKIVGKFHQLLQKANVTEFSDVIPDFHNLEYRKKNFFEAITQANPKRLKIAKEAISLTHDFFEELEKLNHEKLPLRVCHNDTKLNNILFSRLSGKALCLIDLDTLMKGYFYYDFGDAVRTIVNTAPEDEKDHSKITFDNKLFEAFVDGLVDSQLYLSEDEINSLPLGAIFMPFIHGLRALTDYLNDDRYYKVAYENQNFDRSLSLLNFAEKALGKKTYMSKVLVKKLCS